MVSEDLKKVALDLIEKVELLDKLVKGDITEAELKRLKEIVDQEVAKAFECGASLAAFLVFNVKMKVDSLLLGAGR